MSRLNTETRDKLVAAIASELHGTWWEADTFAETWRSQASMIVDLVESERDKVDKAEKVKAATVRASSYKCMIERGCLYRKIEHNLGTKDVVVKFFDANGEQIQPGLTTRERTDEYVDVTFYTPTKKDMWAVVTL